MITIHYIGLCLRKVKLEGLLLAGSKEVRYYVVKGCMEKALRNCRQLLGADSHTKVKVRTLVLQQQRDEFCQQPEGPSPVKTRMRLYPQVAPGLQLSETLSRGPKYAVPELLP